MSATPGKGYSSLSPTAALQVNEACDRFEAAWKGGPRPRIEDFLGDASSPDRSALLCELILLEVEYRRRAGEAPVPAEYQERFPLLEASWLAGAVGTPPGSAEDAAAAAAHLYPETVDLPAPQADPRPAEKRGSTHSGRGKSTSQQVQRIRCPHCQDPLDLVEGRSDEVLCPGCGTSFHVRDCRITTTMSGMRQLGKFQLLERVGLGAFGAVWRARDTQLDRMVALKIPHTGLLSSGAELERFQREARIAAQLRHPGIVTVHEVTTLEELPVLVEDFIHGVPLKDLLQVRRLTFREAATLLAEIAEALDYAHSMGAVHRDIKPANLMVEQRAAAPDGAAAEPAEKGKAEGVGKPLIMDFGLALREGVEITMTVEGQILGTPAYMSPEQALGRGHQADRRSDVYSLGVVLYELLTNELPFRGSRSMMVHQVIHEEPRRPRSLNDKVPRDLETICLKAMAKAPARRYASARALAEDLRRWLNGEPILARPVGPVERFGRWCRRAPLAASLVAGLFIAIVTGLGGVTWQWVRAEREAAHHQRLAELLAQSQELFLKGQAAFAQKDWPRAEARLSQALATIGSEPELAALLAQGHVLLAQSRQQLAEARAETGRLKRQEQAQQAVRDFRRLADEAHFFAAGTNPVAERAPYYDPRQAEAAGKQALVIADDWGAALEQLALADERAALQGELAELLLVLVQAQGRYDQQPKAVETMQARLDRVASLGNPSPGYHRLRAACYRRLGDAAKAAVEEQRAVALRPSATALDHFLLGEDYRTQAAAHADSRTERTTWEPQREQLEKALQEYQHAIKKHPRHYWSHFQIGRCYLGLGRGSEAVAALSTCVALRPEVGWGYSARGLALGLQKQFAAAEQDLSKALALQPDFRPAQLNRGLVRWLAQDIAGARVDFEAVLQPPGDRVLIEAAYYRGQMHLDQGDHAAAREDFDSVVVANPEFRPPYLLRAQVHLMQGKTGACLKDLDAFLSRGRAAGPAGKTAHAQRGRLLRLLAAEVKAAKGKDADRPALLLALDDLRKAREDDGPSATLCDDLGAVFDRLGEPAKAIQAYAEAAARTPADLRATVLTQRGWALVEREAYDEARTDFAAAARWGLDTPEARLIRADAFAGLGYVSACRGAPVDALRAAAQAQALLQDVDHYVVRHNLACIYAKLSGPDAARAAQYEDVAITLLQRAVELARRKGAERQAIEMIRNENFPPALKQRPEFKKLIEGP